tara:strand:- start:27 stop:203 length:177 start_codon:yes stop_codon:yes gene_type:complete
MPTKDERNRSEKEANETKRRLLDEQRRRKFLKQAKKTRLGNMVGKRTDAIDEAFNSNF